MKVVVILFTFSLLGSLSPFAPYADAQVTGTCGSLQRVESAIRLATVIYPALAGRELSLTFSEGTEGALSSPVDARRFLTVISMPQWHPSKENNTSTHDEEEGNKAELAGFHLPVYLEFNFIPPAQLNPTTYRLSCHPLDFTNTAAKQGRRLKQKSTNIPSGVMQRC